MEKTKHNRRLIDRNQRKNIFDFTYLYKKFSFPTGPCWKVESCRFKALTFGITSLKFHGTISHFLETYHILKILKFLHAVSLICNSSFVQWLFLNFSTASSKDKRMSLMLESYNNTFLEILENNMFLSF